MPGRPIPRARPLARLLIATDFTPGAAFALARTARLPLSPRARVRLLHVVPPLGPALQARERAEAARRLEHQAAELRTALRAQGHRSVQVATSVATGEAAAEIVARGRRVDLIVLGRHGTRRFRDLLIGSTAERVLRGGHAPVLIVSTAPRTAYRSPVAAVDLSPSSARTLAAAARLLRPGRRTLSVLHVYQPAHDRLLRRVAGPAEAAAYTRSCRAEAEREVVALLARSPAHPLLREVLLGRGDPRATLLGVAAERQADLLVVGTHGHRPVVGTLIGSVAEGVARHARCDALIVPSA